MPPTKTFSESWYRIADRRVSLRPGVKVSRQYFRGERWHVIENPMSNQYFRVRPEAWEFIARLDGRHTVQEAWEACLARFPDAAPGQEAAIRLLAGLYNSNLLQYDLADDASRLFERFRKRRRKEIGARLAGIMFLRIPLFDPDRLLIRTLPLVGWLISWFGAALWLVVLALAGKTLVDHWPAAVAQGRSILAPDNLLLLYASLVFVKIFHEFGHAWFCRKFGGEVHVMGVMFLIFTPLPYMDATSSWGFRSRWQRLLVAAAGMIVELFVAAIAVFIWAATAPGAINSIAYNMIFIASVSTILFNINPLLRFDGYYMLSDLIDIPNLHQRSWKWISHNVKRHAFGMRHDPAPRTAPRERPWLWSFGILSNIYRIVIFAGILLFVADQFLLLGILMGVICVTGWIFVPLGKFTHFLAANPALDRNRGRAVAVTLGTLALLLGFFGGVPFPSHFRAPGEIRAVERASVATGIDGLLTVIEARPGDPVAAGSPLARLDHYALEPRRRETIARLAEIDAQLADARHASPSALQPLERQRQSEAARLARIEADLARRTVTAPIDGLWHAPHISAANGQWIARGNALGTILGPGLVEFSARVGQQDADRLYAEAALGTPEVRLRGSADIPLAVSRVDIIPVATIRQSSESANTATEADASHEVRALLAHDHHGEPLLFHGRSGEIRFSTGREPLLQQGLRRLFQLLQRRYQW